MTLVMWGNLTPLLDNTSYAAQTLMVRVIDQIYASFTPGPSSAAESQSTRSQETSSTSPRAPSIARATGGTRRVT